MAAFSFSQERDMMFGLRSTGHSRQSEDLPSAMFSAILDDDSLQLLACLEVAAEASERDGEGKDERAIPSLIQTLVSHPLPSHLPPPPDFEPSGSPLHLCCVLDRPVHLALLLIAGGDVEARHGGFRRSVIHESCCSGEGGCLDVLLEVATSHVSEEEDQEQEQGREEGGEQPPPPVSFHTPSRPKSPLGQMPEGSPTSVSQFGGEGEAADFKSKLYLARQLLMKRPNFNPISDPNPDKDVPIHITLMRFMSVPASVSSSLNPHLVQSATDGHGNTPLHWASFKNLPSQVASLLRIGADPNFRAHPSGWTPLHDAAYSDAARAMKLLLSSGANVDSKAASGATPLCFAAQEDCPDCCDLLLSSGASANVRCEGGEGRFSGYTPLHYTAHYNAHRSAKVLVTLGAEMEIRDEMGRLPIHVATSRGSCDVLKELLKAGAQAVIKGDPAPSVPVSPNLSAVPAPPAAPQGENIAQALPIPGPTTHHQLVNLPPPPPSPPLTSLLPHSPVRSSKPWNCITQLQIDACSSLITSADSGWSPKTHHVFTPTDRKGILEVLRVGKRLEQTGTGLHVLDLWPFILGFCGRGWFLDEQVESGQATPKAAPVKVTGYSFFKTGEDYDEGSEEEEYDTDDEDSVRDDRLPPPPPKTERVVEEMEPFSLEGAAVTGQPLGVQGLISWSDFRDDDDDDEDDEDGEEDEEGGEEEIGCEADGE
ncbi:hypothetical protein TrST_g8378 [Triparma strigata]|uniref:Uncharacterized protein n=1 Tax=Triparma strigata TaxID=1606541 RepID=A0A9W7DZ87_9STRA|nr:hypothetical protein TrST_g8378 [Triparma strigata]